MFKFVAMIQRIILLLIVIFTTACQVDPTDHMADYDQYLVNTSPDFKKGWHDGCESGTKSSTNSFYQMFYKGNKQDGFKMATSPEYSNAWNKAWWYCTHAAEIDKKRGATSGLFSGYQ